MTADTAATAPAEGGLIAMDGEVLPAASARVPALDRGLLYGDAALETLVAFCDRILDLAPHLARLEDSVASLGFELPVSVEAIGFELQALLSQASWPKSLLRIVVSRGTGLGLTPPGATRARRLIYCLPAPPADAAPYRDGVALRRTIRPDQSRGPRIKSSNYLPEIQALRKARSEGFGDIIWCNGDGELAEAATSNLFLMARQGDLVEIVTPPEASGILPGITRARVMTLLRQARIPVHEQIVHTDEIPRFDEAFLTSSVQGLVPVRGIDRHQLHSVRPNAVFRQIERLFLTWVESEVGKRVDWVTGQAVR